MAEGRRIVFIDLDGTLVDHHGNMPASAAAAIAQVRRNGHLVYLCTGRSVNDLVDAAHTLELDGAITNSGAFTEVDGEVISAHTFSREFLAELLAFIEAQGSIAFLQANEGVFGDARSIALMNAFLEPLGFTADQLLQYQDIADANLDAVAKIIFFSAADESASAVAERFAGQVDVVPASLHLAGGSGGEVTPHGVNKGSAILDELTRLGIDPAASVGIGDSHNDVDMFKAVGTSIAMGNAVPELKAIADATTTELHNDGVANALKLAGLVEPLESAES